MGLAGYGAAVRPERSALTGDPWAKAIWFIGNPLRDSLNLANFPPSPAVATVVGVLILIGLERHFTGSVGERAVRLGLAAALVPLSYLPNLAIAESWSAYRTQVALTSLIALYTVFALHELLDRIFNSTRTTAMMAGLALASCVVASTRVVTYFVLPQSIELALLRDQIAQVDPATTHTIIVRQASWRDALTPSVAYDEFGVPSTVNAFAPACMAALLQRERHLDFRRFLFEVRPPEASLDATNGSSVIDMRRLATFR
jgi:hypothetical protein